MHGRGLVALGAAAIILAGGAASASAKEGDGRRDRGGDRTERALRESLACDTGTEGRHGRRSRRSRDDESGRDRSGRRDGAREDARGRGRSDRGGGRSGRHTRDRDEARCEGLDRTPEVEDESPRADTPIPDEAPEASRPFTETVEDDPGVVEGGEPGSGTGPGAPATEAFVDAVAVLPLDSTGGGPEYMALRAMGVPVVVTETVDEALEYRVVVVAGTFATGTVDDATAGRLAGHVSRGGVLVGEAVSLPATRPVFGIGAVSESTTRERILFEGSDPTIADLDNLEERVVDLDDPAQKAGVGTVGYSALEGTDVLARFDDGTAALTRRVDPSGGAAYAVGARLLDLITRHQEGARFSSRRAFVNAFDTSADVWQLWLRGVYREAVPGGLTLSTAPAGAPYAVVPTLSANFSAGAQHVPKWLEAAGDRGARVTVFAPTRLVDDWLDTAWVVSDEFTRMAKYVAKYDGELGSHSVSHSPAFARMPMGTGAEELGSYVPFVASRTETVGGTVMGELRVSRQILQGFEARVTSFRSGYLLVPRGLPQALDAAGYLQDSSSTQGWVGGAVPFQVPRLDGKGYSEVTTFPVAFEETGGAKTLVRAREELGAAIVARNGANGAPSVLLYYPTDPDRDAAAIDSWEELLGTQEKAGAWVGPLDEFGAFWRARQDVALLTGPSAACAGGRSVTVTNLSARPVTGLALDAPAGALAVFVHDGSKSVRNEHGKVVLPAVPPKGVLTGDLCPG